MSEYCTIRDVRLALTPNGDAANKETAANLPDWQIEDAILEAEGWVDAYLGTRYSIEPFTVEEVNPENPGEVWVSTVAPSPIRRWTRDIAAYLAALTFRKNKDLSEDDPIRLRYKMVAEHLLAVRDNRMSLDLPKVTLVSQGVHVENLYKGTLFGLEDLGLGYSSEYHTSHIWPLREDVR